MSSPNGAWTDLVSDFMALTEDTWSPDLFRRWSGISLVAGALERRVWARVGDWQTFANLYVLLVAPPGVGKQVIDTVQELWKSAPEPGTSSSGAFHVAPDSVTKAAMLDSLSDAKRNFLPPVGPMAAYHSLLLAAEEFEVLLPSYDREFISNLNKLYNCPESYHERRRTGMVRRLDIDRPTLSILAGAQPAYFVANFPEEAWNTGLVRRIIMIYSAELPFKELFAETQAQDARRAALLRRLSHLASLWGQMSWEAEAAGTLAAWHREGEGKGGPPVPTHSKLEHYCRSRTMHAIKLAMVSAISRTGELVIGLLDVRRAIAWLTEAEALMPDIFRAMTGRSDAQVIEELHYFVLAQWSRTRQAPVSGDSLRRFLLARMPSEKVDRLLDVSERANIVVRVAGTDTWIPRPKHERGQVE